MELISVIIPVYNVEKYLCKCVDSIIAQTYTNLEIILVDDGSPDNCGKICDEYAEKDPRIKVIHQENGGLSAARNAGLDIASGDYIGFVDSDDYIAPDMYQKLYNALITNNADLAICNLMYVDSEGKDLKSYTPAPARTLNGNGIMNLLCEQDNVCYITAVNRLYKKRIFENLRFEPGKTNEDEFIAHKVYSKCDCVVVIEDSLYYYLQRSDSIMGKPITINRTDGVEAVYLRLQFLKENYPQIDLAKASIPLLNAYRYLKVRFKSKTEEEKLRMSEIDSMAEETYKTIGHHSLKDILFFRFRPLYILLFKIKSLLNH